MSTLSEKLRSLGVQIGARDLPAPIRRDTLPSLDAVLSGRSIETPFGETYLVEKSYPVGHQHGNAPLLLTAPLNVLANWAGNESISGLPPEAFAFLDTETTGLSGGSGTYAFLIGVGRFENGEFRLAQFFMRDPLEEPGQLMALEQFLAPCQALVTYNGKAFDLPLLVARYVSQGWMVPFSDYAHIDLLHLARRLWHGRLPSRSLGNVEASILGTMRTEDDVPGWMIPQMYFDYLRSGDAQPLRSVFYHNAMDVVSLASLLNYSAALLADPLTEGAEHGVDLFDLAHLFEDMGDIDSATRLYINGIKHPDVIENRMPEEEYIRALERLALIYKRDANFTSAASLWMQATRHRHLESHIELAKFYEHHARDFVQALRWTRAAIELLDSPQISNYPRSLWLAELEHRQERLLSKISR